MGAAAYASSDISKIVENVVTQTCNTVSEVYDTKTSCKIKIKNCDNANIKCGNVLHQVAQCDLDAIIETTVSTAIDLNHTVKGGLGFTASWDDTKISEEISSALSNACNTAAKAQQVLAETEFECDGSKNLNLEVLNQFDQTALCALSALNKLASSSETKVTDTTSGFLSELGDMTWLIAVVAVIGVLAVIGGVVYAVMQQQKKKEGGEAGGKGGNEVVGAAVATTPQGRAAQALGVI